MRVTLYHYTCSCALEKIRADGWTLRPNYLAPKVGLPALVWLTDMENPDKGALGLTGVTLSCDRTEYRLTVAETDGVLPWSKWCRANGFTRRQRDWLELGNPFGSANAAQPRRWFVSPEPVKAIPQ
jgi:hypothetical protein